MKRREFLVTANFERNLDGLEAFRTEHPSGFVRLLERLEAETLPLLRGQPGVGRLYAQGQPASGIIENIRLRLGGGALREILVGEYVVLYLVGEKRTALMSIRHGRELDFDFGD
jgi:hypothetical protein